MASEVYTKEQLNYLRICHIVTNILPRELRSICKREWDNRYQPTLGEWKDTPKNGLDFYHSESPRSRSKNAPALAKVITGNRKEWDCTTLFFAILYSDSIGRGLSATVRSNVDDLREIRNKEFAHMPQGELPDLQFRLAVRRIEIAFLQLRLPTLQIQTICKQKTFRTDEVKSLLEKVQYLLQDLQETQIKLETSEKQRQVVEKQRQVLEVQLKNEASSFSILPPKPSHEIASRDGEVDNITRQLDKLRQADENSLSFLYITGNPGSGKSQLAGLVAKKFYDREISKGSVITFVMTLNAENSQTLLESYVSLARQVKCPEYHITDTRSSQDTKIDLKIKNLRDLIASKMHLYASWLMVVDNVTCVSAIHDLLPQLGSEQWNKGQLLITTQDSSSIPATCSFISHVSMMKGMEPLDARCFLANISGLEDPKTGDQVAKVLDYQPLALASAGTYVKKIRESVASDFGWKEYLDKLERGMRALTEKELTKTNPSYSKSMTAATRLAVEKAIESDGIVKNAFTFLSLCAHQAFHLDILKNYVLNIDKHVEKEEAAIQIQGYSLLLLEERQNGVFIGVHKITHEVIKSVIYESQEQHEYAQSVHAALIAFNQYIDIELSNTWNELNSIAASKHLIPHLKALATKVKDVFDTRDESRVFGVNVSNAVFHFQRFGQICENHCELFVAKLYYDIALKLVEQSSKSGTGKAVILLNLGNVQYQMGKLQQANELYERALGIQLKKLGPTHVDVATTHNNLGNVRRALGDLQQAKEYHERALDIQLKKLGREHVDVAGTYNNLGNVQRTLGDLQPAKKSYEHALNIQMKELGPEHVSVARTYNNLGNVQRTLGVLQQAKENYERALNIQMKKLGSDHVAVANTYNNLGNVQRTLGCLQQAKENYERALDIQLKKLGPEHVDVAGTYNNLGNVQRTLGDLQQAKENYERTLDIQVKKLGPAHVDVAFSYNNLGVVQGDLGNLQQAKENYERALDIQRKKLGPGHVAVANTCNNLGNVRRTLGDLQQAKESYERALEIQLKKLGPEHVDVAGTYNNLGNLQRTLGDLKQAKEYYERALDMWLKMLGPEHVDVARTYNNLGNVQRMLGNLQQAKENYERALDIQMKKLGPEHADVARTYNNVGNVQRTLGDLQQAKTNYERALDIQLKKLGPDHVDVAGTYNNLGNVQRTLGDLQQAKENFERALDIQLNKLKPEHVAVANTYNNLGNVHRMLGDLQHAKENIERARDILFKTLGPKHIAVANTYNNLGNVQRMLGDLQQAKASYERALDIQLKKLGPRHVDVAGTYNNLGYVQRKLGDLQQAKECHERALDIQLKKLGTRHVVVARTLNDLGNVQRSLGNLEQAN